MFSSDDLLYSWIIQALNHSWSCLDAETPCCDCQIEKGWGGGGLSMFILQILIMALRIWKPYVLKSSFLEFQWLEGLRKWSVSITETPSGTPECPRTLGWKAPYSEVLNLEGGGGTRDSGRPLSAMTDGWGGSDTPASDHNHVKLNGNTLPGNGFSRICLQYKTLV